MAMEGLFGQILFGKLAGRIMTFHELNRTYKSRYGVHMVHMRKPLHEWGGPDTIKIDMPFSLNAAWCGDPVRLLNQWHYYEENALAAPLIIGGKPMAAGMSLFVLTELKEKQKHWLSPGQLISVELDAHFEEYIASTDVGGLNLNDGFFGFGGLF